MTFRKEYMEDERLMVPRRALSDLRRLFIPENAPLDSSLCLSIIIDNSEVNVREFAAYLDIIDITYGRLTQIGINAYSMRPREQLKIDNIGPGSWELKFIEILANAHNIQILFIIYLMLKYLPGGVERLSAAYKNYEEGRLLRERRHNLRRQMKEDPDLIELPHARKNQLIILIDELLLRGRRFLPRASRFSWKYVRRVNIKVLSNSGKKSNEKENK